MKPVGLLVCCLATIALCRASGAEVYGELHCVQEARSFNPGSIDPGVARWLLTLPAGDSSFEADSALVETAQPEASFRQMIQPDFIGGRDYYFIRPNLPQPVAEHSEVTFRPAEGRSASREPRRIARGVRKGRVVSSRQACVCSSNGVTAAASENVSAKQANYGNSAAVIGQILEKGPFLLLE